MEHVRLIDGLRALAAGLVLVSHVAFWTGASAIDVTGGLLARGDSGVAVFFAISAFLLLSPAIRRGLARDKAPGRPISDYALRRAARILPAYWLALAGVLAVGALAQTKDGVGSLRTIVTHILMGQAFTSTQYQGFSQSWSLTTEVTFYIAVPALSWLLIRRLTRGDRRTSVRHVLTGIVFAGLLGLTSQGIARALMTTEAHQWGAVLGLSALGHLAWFAGGAFVAVVVETRRLGLVPWDRERLWGRGWTVLTSSRSTLLVTAILMYLIAASPLAGPRDLSDTTVAQALVKESLYAVFALLLLLVAVQPVTPGTAVARWADSPANRWLGDISYGVFLWHVLVIQLVFLVTGSPLFAASFWWTLYPVVTLTLIIASLSWYFAEKPVLTQVRRRTRSARAPSR